VNTHKNSSQFPVLFSEKLGCQSGISAGITAPRCELRTKN
jgi:hypothetical protein